MNKRWMLSYDGGTTFDEPCEPINGGSVRFERKRDLPNGQVFFRRTLATSLRFQDTFKRWFALRKSAGSCGPIFIRREYFCQGVWKVFWTGRFSPADCDFDLDKCTVSVQPDTWDQYSCLLERQDDRVNVLWVEPENVRAQVAINIEWGFYVRADVFGCIYEQNQPFNVQGGTWSLAHTHTFNPGPFAEYEWRIYWRETVTTECINGVGVPPAGTGWNVLYDNCVFNGTVTWWRVPITPYTYGNSFAEGAGSCGPGTIQTLVFQGGPVDSIDCGDTQIMASRYICVPDDQIDFPRARPLEAVTNYILEKSNCGDKHVRSDFFEWDPIGDAPGYFPGTNYVTGIDNTVNHLFVLQKSDAITPGATNPAAIGEMTLKELFEFIRVMFQVFWDLDKDGNLRFEHWKYWTFTDISDLRLEENLLEPNSFTSVNSTVPKIERFKFAEAGLKDFVGADIIYEGPCTNDEVEEYTIGQITTDISFVITDPNSIDNRGFVMLAAEDVNGWSTIIQTGALSLSPVTNAPLSVANLEDSFWRWNRYLPEANMNTRAATFDGVRPNIEQQGVTMDLCCRALTFDPRDSFKTNMGETKLGGRLAEVVQVAEDEKSELTTLTLSYYI